MQILKIIGDLIACAVGLCVLALVIAFLGARSYATLEIEGALKMEAPISPNDSPTWKAINRAVRGIDTHVVAPAQHFIGLVTACKDSIKTTVNAWEAGRKAAK